MKLKESTQIFPVHPGMNPEVAKDNTYKTEQYISDESFNTLKAHVMSEKHE